MSSDRNEDSVLPLLREDLEITPGAPLVSGAPSWVIYDPVRHRFFQIGRRTVEIISRWSAGTVDRLRQRMIRELGAPPSDRELETLVGFLRQNNLLARGEHGSSQQIAKARIPNRMKWLQILAHRYFFFKVPLVRPQSFLNLTWPFVRPLFSKLFVWITAGVFFFAAYLASRQAADLERYFRATLVGSGIGYYAVAVLIVKSFHEVGHAYQAVSRGLRVPVMGVAFVIMFPLLYTDVSDAWRLQRRQDRMMVDAGGVIVEIIVAVYATLLWCFLPDGGLRSAVFAIATTSWLFSLLVNLNPFMRFDGYYFLSDALGVQNLQSRSFAMGKWALRQTLFGTNDTPPERLSARLQRFFVLYAFAVWLYRLLLFLTIALIAYFFLFKALGILVFAMGVFAFIIQPIIREIHVWVGMRGEIMSSPRSWLSFVLVGLLLLATFWPISGTVKAPAIIEEAHQQVLFPPASGQLDEIYVSEGSSVFEGDPLFRFVDPGISINIDQARTMIATYETLRLRGAGDAVVRGESNVIEEALQQERQRLAGLLEKQDAMLVVAVRPGVIRDLSSDIAPGSWVSQQKPLARLIAPGEQIVQGFVSEADRARLNLDRPVHFIADNIDIPIHEIAEIEIADYSVRNLPDGYLSEINGGGIDVVLTSGDALTTIGVWYPITGTLGTDTLATSFKSALVQAGIIRFETHPEAVARRLWRQIVRVLVRESGF